MVTQATERRIAALESRRHANANGFGGTIFLQGCESVEDAARRLGLSGGAYLVVGAPMTEADWCNAAKSQQAALVKETFQPFNFTR